jgi:hypothetical protein
MHYVHMLDTVIDRPAPSTSPSDERFPAGFPGSQTADAGGGGVEHAVSHSCDDDCRPHLDAEGIECAVCGVSWSDGCAECGGHAFHRDGCTESDDYEPPAPTTCTNDDHRQLKAEIYATREYATTGSSEPLAYPMSEREAAWWRTARPWPGTGLVIGECACRSSVTICAECEGTEEVELRSGRVIKCDCARDDVDYDTTPRVNVPRARAIPAFDHFFSEAAGLSGSR